nr:hypothetical protein [Tanacetum cinerariifolium]
MEPQRRNVPVETSTSNALVSQLIHTAKTEMMKLMFEIECVGMNADEFDKETGSSDGLQPKQIPYQFDVGHKFAPFRRKIVQELYVHLKLFQFHVVDIHIIKEQ